MTPVESELYQALLQSKNHNVDLVRCLRDVRDDAVKTAEEAHLIVELLAMLPRTSNSDSVSSELHALTDLFQSVETEEAFQVLSETGISELCRIFDVLSSKADEPTVDDLLFVLKILAMYRSPEGTKRVISAARATLKPDAYMWSMILGQFTKEHPHAVQLLDALTDPLPPGFLRVALLDCANGYAIGGGDEAFRHPFDTPGGKQQLHDWLTSANPNELSYAQSATASLPFISNPERDQLLALALDHPQVDVQMEAAWASAKLGSQSGLMVLRRYCSDPGYSVTACRYLEELHRDDLIPAEANDPKFRARAEFASWLAHPNELGRVPDEVEILDHRVLAWPPDGELKPLWLVKYRVKDTTGLADDDLNCGLVGSITFCLFSYKLLQRPPEDAYAIHCYWEMEGQGLIQEIDAKYAEEDVDMPLEQWTGAALERPGVRCKAVLSPELRYPQSTVTLVSATLHGSPGWVVLDGPRSRWYAQSEMPEDVHESTILMVHVGRRLLGFNEEPNRKLYLVGDVEERSADEIVAAYERLLIRAGGEEDQAWQLLKSGSPLGEHFAKYVHAVTSLRGIDRHTATVQAYDQLWDAAKGAGGNELSEIFDNFSPLGRHLEEYSVSLAATGNEAQIDSVIELLAPYWQHNMGFQTLGKAAFTCGRRELAESMFLKLRESSEFWHRGDSMTMLADVWVANGEPDRAQQLLLECLARLVEESRSATGSDKQLFENWFQEYRSAMLRLFPNDGTSALSERRIPSTTLNN